MADSLGINDSVSISHDLETLNFAWLSGGTSIALVNQLDFTYRIFDNFWKGSEDGKILSVVYSDTNRCFYGLVARKDNQFFIHKMNAGLEGVEEPKDGSSINRAPHHNTVEIIDCKVMWKSGECFNFLGIYN